MAVAFFKRDFEDVGYIKATVPDLNVGQTILFEGQKDHEQGWVVNRILRVPHIDAIIVEVLPEYSNVRSATLFHYGMKKFRLKSLPASERTTNL